jgi:hypothetical protein
MPQAGSETLANLDDHAIAQRLTHGVVERLEAIEIHKQHSVLPLRVAPRPGKQVLQAVEEETAVG